MATEIKLPRLGQGMESGTIVKWLKSEGDQVKKGEPLYELDTDKVTQEVEAEANGVLLKIAIEEGEVEVGRTIAFIGEPGEKVEAESAEADSANGGAPSQAPVAEVETKAVAAETRRPEVHKPLEPAEGRLKASPLARRIARERDIDLAQINGTGPEGRIVAEDVERFAAAPTPAAARAAAPAEVE